MADTDTSLIESRPLLAFGPPGMGPIPPDTRRFPPQPSRPSAGRQGQRLTPQFAALRDAMAAGRMDASQRTIEPDPELVVVFELVGTVEAFSRAVSQVSGLEFLAEIEEDDAEPDEDFHFVEDGRATTDLLGETLYVVMSNAQAVTELISLFERWQANPGEQFARGLNPLRNVFAQLRSVRRWGPQDRIRETGLIDSWREEVEVVGTSGSTRVEIELWFRGAEPRRTQAQAQVTELVTEAGGTVISTAIVDAVDYHGMLVDLPQSQVDAVLANGPEAIALLTTEDIMFVSPARPMMIPALEIADDQLVAEMPPPPTKPPRVALLDGLPLANHALLTGRLIIDDPDECAARYTSSQQHHGTAMASLISHGDLNNPRPPLSTSIYVRPILQPHPFDGAAETIVRDELLVDLIHRSFHRIFEGDGTDPPAAGSVRIVNLSIGNPARVFTRRMSPLAKLLDWLAHKYNLLILVSAGNHSIATTVPADAVDDVDALRSALVNSTYQRARQRRLLSPAEAVNVLTVGALHSDAMTGPVPDTVLDGLEPGMPALYNAVGFGFRRSVKPEILLPGGRSLYQRPPAIDTGELTLTAARTAARGPGLRVGAPGGIGLLNATAHSYGTSNATALATRASSHIFDVLESADAIPGEFPFPDAQYHPVLAKTLLVHAASWGSLRERLSDLLGLEPVSTRRDLTQLLGYGAVDPSRVATATRTRVVLLGAGSIMGDERHQFAFPLPPSLASTTEWRRLTITLGWLSPVNARSQRHRMARLFFQPPQDELRVARTDAHHSAARKGTIQHEILEGRAAVVFTANQALAIEVDCRIDAGKANTPIRYGLAVSLELATTIRADVHAEIKQALRVQLRDRLAAQAQLAGRAAVPGA
jgi:hypothetical protein